MRQIIYETIEALWQCLGEEVFPTISKPTWHHIAEGFAKQWNFLNCIGKLTLFTVKSNFDLFLFLERCLKQQQDFCPDIK